MNNPDPIRQGWTSASNSEADTACPGRHIAQRGLPETESADASFGSLIHQALADSGDRSVMTKLTLEQREIFDACRDIEKKLALQYFGDDPQTVGGKGQGIRVYRHRRFWLKLTNKEGKGIFQHSGEVDVCYQAGSRLLVLDYKCLAGDKTDSPKNGQLRDLAVLAAGEIPETQEVAVAIVQPLVSHSPELCLYGPDDLKRAAIELYGRIVKSNDPKSPRVAGVIQCAYCLAKPNCREYQAWASQMVPAPRSILDVPVAQWTGEQCAIFLDHASVAQRWLDDCKDAVKARVEADPAAVPGWTLKPGAIKETITDPQACFDRFSALGGNISQFMGTVSVRKGKLKEAIHAVTAAKGQQLDKAVKALTEGITEQKQNAPSLVKIG
jgi:hypothetical protein